MMAVLAMTDAAIRYAIDRHDQLFRVGSGDEELATSDEMSSFDLAMSSMGIKRMMRGERGAPR